MKKVLFVASECVPFIKTGGLADVVGSLPKYFDKNEFDVRVMIPKYVSIPEEYKNQMEFVTHFYLELAWRKQYVGIFQMQYQGVTFYFLDMNFILAEIVHMERFIRTLRNLRSSVKQHCLPFRLSVFARISSIVMTGRPV